MALARAWAALRLVTDACLLALHEGFFD